MRIKKWKRVRIPKLPMALEEKNFELAFFDATNINLYLLHQKIYLGLDQLYLGF